MAASAARWWTRPGVTTRPAGSGSRSRPPWRCRRPYRPEPGQPVYQISAGGHAAQVAEKDLAGPLRELVSAVLSERNHG